MPVIHRVYLGLGSNTEPKHYLQQGLEALQQLFGALQCSPVFESESVGINTENFYNLVVGLATGYSLAQLSQTLKQIEREHGRYSEHKQRITLDIDILLFDDQITEQPLTIPRTEILHNAFVLWPLAIIAGDVMHPVVGERFAKLWQEAQINQHLWPVEFTWQQQALTSPELLSAYPAPSS